MNYISDNKIYINDDWYYTISRKNGRIIFAPCKKLKKEQRYLLNAIKWKYPLKLSTLQCAKIHAGKKYVLKMDIKNFYNSVPYRHIVIIMKNICQHIQYSNINYYLNITTVNRKLPTGAPTSTHIADACFKIIDNDIHKYCKIWDIDYSRYVDDLTFSTNEKYLLNMVEKKVEAILNYYGYKLNKKKTKYISDNKQQNILGHIVNNGYTRLPKEFKRNVRAMLHHYAIYISHQNINYYENKQQLTGYIAYIRSVDSSGYEKIKTYGEKLMYKYNIYLPFFDN